MLLYFLNLNKNVYCKSISQKLMLLEWPISLKNLFQKYKELFMDNRYEKLKKNLI